MDREQQKGLRHGMSKIEKLKSEIQTMWSDLEVTYNNDLATNLENELQGRKTVLFSLYNET